jgi:hypothetical protein
MVVLLTELLILACVAQVTGLSPGSDSVVCDKKNFLSAHLGDGTVSGRQLAPLLSVIPNGWFFDRVQDVDAVSDFESVKVGLFDLSR